MMIYRLLELHNEIETAVTKVGNDVKVTLGLPDTVEVTASVATRANSLAPTATASQADNATTASHAITAVSASATIAGNLFPTTQGLETNYSLNSWCLIYAGFRWNWFN
jgi:hypothetical protein